MLKQKQLQEKSFYIANIFPRNLSEAYVIIEVGTKPAQAGSLPLFDQISKPVSTTTPHLTGHEDRLIVEPLLY